MQERMHSVGDHRPIHTSITDKQSRVPNIREHRRLP